MDAAAMRLLSDHIPFFHRRARVRREWERAIAEHHIVVGKAKDRRLQVFSKCNSLKMLLTSVEGTQEFGGDLCQGRIVFHDQKSHNLSVCDELRHSSFGREA